MRMGVQRHAPAALPPRKTRYPLCGRLGGPQGRSRLVRKISPPPGFGLRTVQPVAIRYIDWAIPAHDAVVELHTFLNTARVGSENGPRSGPFTAWYTSPPPLPRHPLRRRRMIPGPIWTLSWRKTCTVLWGIEVQFVGCSAYNIVTKLT